MNMHSSFKGKSTGNGSIVTTKWNTFFNAESTRIQQISVTVHGTTRKKKKTRSWHDLQTTHQTSHTDWSRIKYVL